MEDELQRLHDVPVELAVEIGRTRMTIGETLALGPGSIVSLNRLAGEPVDLLVNGRPIARGEVVVVDEEFGLRVTEIVSAAPALVRTLSRGSLDYELHSYDAAGKERALIGQKVDGLELADNLLDVGPPGAGQSSFGRWIVGDTMYGGRVFVYGGVRLARQALHAAEITFVHPATLKTLTLAAPLPPDVTAVLARHFACPVCTLLASYLATPADAHTAHLSGRLALRVLDFASPYVDVFWTDSCRPRGPPSATGAPSSSSVVAAGSGPTSGSASRLLMGTTVPPGPG